MLLIMKIFIPASIKCTPCMMISKGLLYLALVLIKQVWSDKFLQPFGPKMCVSQCYNTKDCSVPRFDKVHLTCLLDSTGIRIFGKELTMSRAEKRKKPKGTAKNFRDDITAPLNSCIGFESGTTPPSLQVPGCPPAEVNALHEACEKGITVEVKRLLCRKLVSANCRDENGRTAVMIAFWHNQSDISDFLVKKTDLLAVDNDNTTILHYACFGGSIRIVKTLLENSEADIEHENKKGQTPLMFAVMGGHTQIIMLLKDKGVDLQTTSNNNTILHVACKSGHVNMVKYILSLEIFDIDCKGSYGRTPLMSAVCEGHIPIVDLLKARGANLKAVDHDNYTILHMACKCGVLNMVRYVLSLGVIDIESKGVKGRTPLIAAVCSGHIEIVNLLKKKGADLKAVSGDNNSILHTACECGIVKMVKYVLFLNVIDIESKSALQKTPLMIAVCAGHIDVVDFLKKKGANLKAADEGDSNILHIACQCGDLNMVKYVISLNIIDIESKELSERTPLLIAVCEGHIDIVDLLKKKGANLKVMNGNDENILHIACHYGDLNMAKYVLSLNIIDIESKSALEKTPLMKAVCTGAIDVVDFLKKKGANLKAVDGFSSNILHIACQCVEWNMMKYVISLNIIDIESKDVLERTPLMTAVCEGHIGIVDFLMEKGANCTAVDNQNKNILHTACSCGRLDMVKYVISLDIIDINCKNDLGRTPSMFAACAGNIDVVDILKKKGANLKAVDDYNQNILHMACLCCELRMVKFIISQKMIDIDSRDQFHRTPLLEAICQGCIPVVKTLIDLGADPNLVDEDDNNFPHMACFCGNIDMVKYVFSLKTTDIESRGFMGRTPLLTAVCEGHINVVKILSLRYGASVTVSDDRGFNALHLACEKGHLGMVKYLITLEELRGFERRKNKHRFTPIRVARRNRHFDIVAFLRAWAKL